ncbi:MAG: 50S ribosomal protein L30 [Bacteroidetes bacterium]|jgi:large subunit ribosomal protein L30|nr:50S ribosomal protein L30 [Bacteroidota bacterium]MDA0942680.1 50S ribosomal protein L30 [Bacteroidota bacterium]MDA1111334.1 50S ribosomal protein L30 [Bacteroidota bacterium]
MSKVKITQIKSGIGYAKNQKATLVALGIRKMNASRVVELNPQVEGMIRTVSHLLKVENVD